MKITHSVTVVLGMELDDVVLATQIRNAGQVESMIDIGCGWGEWIPAALQQGVQDQKLPETFRYLGVDIAWQPIKHLKEVHKHSFAPKLDFDVLDGVQDALPKGYQVALVRYVTWQDHVYRNFA